MPVASSALVALLGIRHEASTVSRANVETACWERKNICQWD